MEKINEARANITEESLKIKGVLATFIEETINDVAPRKKQQAKSLMARSPSRI